MLFKMEGALESKGLFVWCRRFFWFPLDGVGACGASAGDARLHHPPHHQPLSGGGWVLFGLTWARTPPVWIGPAPGPGLHPLGGFSFTFSSQLWEFRFRSQLLLRFSSL